jgi:hypothetical protein
MTVSLHETSGTALERLKEQIHDAAAPFRAIYEEAVSELEAKQREVDELRNARDSAAKFLRIADPEYFEANGITYKGAPNTRNGKPQKKSGGSSAAYGPGSPRSEEMAVWFQQRAGLVNALNEGEGFYVTALIQAYGSELPAVMRTQSNLAKVCRTLHETGVLRLARIGGKGQRKYYKVVV